MKIWAVPSSMLDNGRLLRQHQSIHGALHEILKKPTKRTQNRFYRHGGYLVLRHWEIVNEMRLRGMNHHSYVDLLWKQIPESRRQILFEFSNLDIVKDVRLLQSKQKHSHISTGTCGRIAAEGIPETINELARKHANGSLPKDVFLI